MRDHTSHTRDAALFQLSRINRWMIAGSVVLTGVFTEIAAHAFPGKAAKPRAAAEHGASPKTSKGSSGGTSEKPLAAPSQAPQAQEPRAQEAAPPQESAAPAEPAAPESAPPEGGSEAAPQEPAHEAAPSEPAPQQEAPREPGPEPSGPVISGGS
jgi:hypothetical protein